MRRVVLFTITVFALTGLVRPQSPKPANFNDQQSRQSSSGALNPIDFGAVGDGKTNDTNGWANMLEKIGSSPAAVTVPRTSGQFLLSNITIPANVTLDFTQRGGIKVVTGQIVTIKGPIIAQPVQIFFNCKSTAGEGEINFGTTSHLNASRAHNMPGLQRDYWVEWFGAIADDTTDSADALDAAFVALPNGCTMHMTGAFYKISHGVTFQYKLEASLVGNYTDSGVGGHTVKPAIVYVGTPGGTAFTAGNCIGCTFKGFSIYSNDGKDMTKGADIGMSMTFDKVAKGYPNISSHNYVEQLLIWALNKRTNWIGLSVTNPNGQNNEQHIIRECEFIGGFDYTSRNQRAILLGHSQVKAVVLERNSFTNVGIGVFALGNFHSSHNIFESVGVAYWGQYLIESTNIDGDDAENVTNIFVAAQGIQVVSFSNCRYEAIHAKTDSVKDAAVQMAGAGVLTFTNCLFSPATYPTPFNSYFFGSTIGFPEVIFRGCIWLVQSPKTMSAGWATANTLIEDGRYRLTYGVPLAYEGGIMFAGTTPGFTVSRPLLSMPGPTSVPISDPIYIGSGSIGLVGLHAPEMPVISGVGTGGKAHREFTMVAVDAAGRRTTFALNNSNGLSAVTAWNETLDATNYLHFTWSAQSPAPDHYALYDVNENNRLQWRFVANIKPSGGETESYDLQFNPTGPYVSMDVFRDEAELVLFRSTVLHPTELKFTDGDRSPNVAAANDFVTANTAKTTIINFANPTRGQIIRVRSGDSYTTIKNNNYIVTGTEADITAAEGAIYTFVYREKSWHLVTSSVNLAAQVNGVLPATNGGRIVSASIAGTSQSAVANSSYVANNASPVTITLPASASVGDVVEVVGYGAGGWSVAQNPGQTIHTTNGDTTTGARGHLDSGNRYNVVKLVCAVANTDWVLVSATASPTVH